MSKLLIDESPLQVIPSLAAAIGLNEAIFIQQLHYWLNQSKTTALGCKWVYNTVEEWKEQFPFWSERTIRRIVESLREKKLISTVKLNANTHDHTLYFTICYDNLDQVSGQCGQIDSAKLATSDSAKLATSDSAKLATSLQEITQENTTETAPQKNKPASQATPAILIKTFLANCLAKNENPIPETDPVFDYAAQIKLPDYFLEICWYVFKRDYQASGKKQKDWRAVFRNCVKGNWKKLWWIDSGGNFELTTAGKQAQLEMKATA